MSNSVKVILFSQVALPFSKVGSWTTLYKNYLQTDHKIDVIVCPKPEQNFESVQYCFVKPTFYSKLQRKFLKRKNTEYFQILGKLILPNQKYIIQIIDNYGMVTSLKKHLVLEGIDNQCYIQFFYHGFTPYIQENAERDFYSGVDEMIFLTNDSYIEHKAKIGLLPQDISVLHNGIDTKIFSKVSGSEKKILKKQLGLEGKTIFTWCSQDRPKKGLSLILDVWSKIYTAKKNMALIVIGCDPREEMEGVYFFGKIPNNELPKFFQASDCYLFPTLWQEGFGLSLVEALHCGNYCIASSIGGVPEVLQYGKLGKLVEDPHSLLEWEVAIHDFLEGKIEIPKICEKLYSMENWRNGMNVIINNAKKRLNQ